MSFSHLLRLAALSILALSVLVVAPVAARADDGPKPPTIDLSRWNDQPVYPDGAVDRKEQGNTVLAIDFDKRGRILKVTVDTTSGFDDLDQAAIAAAKTLRFNAASDGHKDVPGTMKLTVHYQLTALPKTPITEADIYAVKDPGELIVCRRVDPPLGSYVAPKPECHTQREWEAIAKQKRDQRIPERHNGPFIPN